MFYSLEREKDTTPSRDVSTKREKRGSAMLETRSRMKRRQEINRAVWISCNVVCNNSTASFFFFFYRKFDEKEISTLWILWVFLVEEVNIKKKEKKRKRKIRRKYTKSVQQFFGLLSVSPLLKLETCGVAAWRKDKGFCTRKLKFYFEQTNCNEFSREIFFLLIKFLQRRTNVFSSWWLIRRREYELKICRRRERVWKRR